MIYKINCKTCGLNCTGETSTPLHLRIVISIGQIEHYNKAFKLLKKTTNEDNEHSNIHNKLSH